MLIDNGAGGNPLGQRINEMARKTIPHASAVAASLAVLAIQAICMPPRAAESVVSLDSAQITSGAAAYAEHCGACHGEGLTGLNHAPSLKGAAFWKSWTDKPARALYSRIISTMPLSEPGTLEPKVVLDVTVFILSANKQSIPEAGYKSADELNGVPIKRVD
jgi:mono/diheme cytochrome c family protein